MKDEFAFIDSVTPVDTHQVGLIQGIGDDAALYETTADFEQVICVDTMVEGVHFRKDTLTPFQIGRKSLAINLSDLAAMGAIPRYYLVSIAIPSHWDEHALQEIYRGMAVLASRYQIDLIGGDTVSTNDGLVITITVTGEVEKGRHLLRSQAKPGDVVFITGEVGLSAAGFELISQKGIGAEFSTKEEKLAVKAHQEPTAQVEAGRILAQSDFRVALNDVSDGVASEANEIATASRVNIELDVQKLPVESLTRINTLEKAHQWALFGGEDFQLIGTMDKQAFQQIAKPFKQALIPITVIGEVHEGETGVWLKEGDSTIQLERKGYNHFDKDK